MRKVVMAWVVMMLAAAGLSAAEKKPGGSVERKPNIIFIMADDLGIGEVGCYGGKRIPTPNIDRLAREGMRFTDYYCGVSVCAPSRSVLMTGQHTGHTWVRGNAGKTNPAAQALRPEDITVAEVLKAAGYATGLTGKWGLGDTNALAEQGLPTRQGFDFFFGYHNQHHAHNYYPPFVFRNEEKVMLPNKGKFDESGAGVATEKKVFAHDLILEEGLRWIEANKDKPFFYYAAWTLPHANNEANRDIKNGAEVPTLGEFASKDWTEQNKGHAAMIAYLDMQVGRLMEHLKKLGLDEQTIVLFTSDNGPHRESGNDPEFFKSSGPHQGIKRSLYEGGIRVPMIVRWPGKVKAGSVSDHVSYHGDMMATFAELAGVSKPAAATDSVSMVPTLLGRGEQKQHPYLYWEFYEQGSRQAVRFGKWKAVRQPMLTGPVELYDLSSDLAEAKNLASSKPDVVAEATKYLNEAHVPNPNWPVPTPGAAKSGGGKKKGK